MEESTVVMLSVTSPGTVVSATTAAFVRIRSVAVSRREKLQVPDGDDLSDFTPNGYTYTPEDVYVPENPVQVASFEKYEPRLVANLSTPFKYNVAESNTERTSESCPPCSDVYLPWYDVPGVKHHTREEHGWLKFRFRL